MCRWISMKTCPLFELFFQRQRRTRRFGSSEDFEWQPRPLRDVPLKSILSVSITGRLSPFVNRSGWVSGDPLLTNPWRSRRTDLRRIRIADLSGGRRTTADIPRGLPRHVLVPETDVRAPPQIHYDDGIGTLAPRCSIFR